MSTTKSKHTNWSGNELVLGTSPSVETGEGMSCTGLKVWRISQLLRLPVQLQRAHPAPIPSRQQLWGREKAADRVVMWLIPRGFSVGRAVLARLSAELGSENMPGSYCSGSRHSCPPHGGALWYAGIHSSIPMTTFSSPSTLPRINVSLVFT